MYKIIYSRMFSIITLLIKTIMLLLIVINYINFWLITSDVPICIDMVELKSVLYINIAQIFLTIMLTICSLIKKKVNIIIFIIESVFLYLWAICANNIPLYESVENYKFIIIFSIICLGVGILSNIYLLIQHGKEKRWWKTS